MTKGPCYECEDRVIGCHSNCKKYIQWAEERREVNAKIIREKNIDALITGHVVGTIRRNKKHVNR